MRGVDNAITVCRDPGVIHCLILVRRAAKASPIGCRIETSVQVAWNDDYDMSVWIWVSLFDPCKPPTTSFPAAALEAAATPSPKRVHLSVPEIKASTMAFASPVSVTLHAPATSLTNFEQSALSRNHKVRQAWTTGFNAVAEAGAMTVSTSAGSAEGAMASIEPAGGEAIALAAT